ncbi:MAG: 3-keto-5-aminohexanoate cleavage protein [Gemmatimonadales bacterium]
MLLEVALNGSRRREEHPSLPVTPRELATAAREAVAAGAGAVHLHLRDRSGAESVAAADVAHALDALRSTIPDTPIGVSTGAWIVRDVELRHRLVRGWTARPDFASVNFHEPGAEPLAELLLTLGVGIEAGLADTSGAERLARSGLAPQCLRVLMEPQEQEMAEALHTVGQIEAVLRQAGIELRCMLHGVDRTAWAFLTEASRRGYDTRIGFEDTLTLPDGSMAESNAVLIAEARRILGRGSPTPS